MVTAETPLELANRLFRNGQYDEAITAYEMAIANKPEMAHLIRLNIMMAEKRKAHVVINGAARMARQTDETGEGVLEAASAPAAAIPAFEALVKPEGLDDYTFERIKESGLFDVAWYREQYGHLLTPEEYPLAHYLAHGVQQGLNPSPGFDTRYYLESNPDVAEAGINPFVHYVLQGHREGRRPLLYFPSPSDQSPSSLVSDIQSRPYRVVGEDTIEIKIDLACHLWRHIVVVGWSNTSIALGLKAEGRELLVERRSVYRPDVATHFGLSEDTELGFILIAEYAGSKPVMLTWKTAAFAQEKSRLLAILNKQQLTDGDKALLSVISGRLALAYEPKSEAWRQFVNIAPIITTAPCAYARGHVEFALANKNIEQGVLVGWGFHTPTAYVWIEDETGAVHTLDNGFRWHRQDVYDAFANEFGHAVQDAGFAVHIPGIKPGMKVSLKACSEEGVHLLMQTTCGEFSSDPVAAARWLFGIECPRIDFYRRVERVDEPLISALIEYRQSMWAALPVRVTRLGEPVGYPQVSIIIPLYGRMDFVEHQLIEFSQDEWLTSNAEIIYVVDDPKLVEPFAIEAQALHRLYRLPFTWVWGGVNRGFSGANNLGAEYARGDYVIFLNSDAFPQHPGWAQDLIDVLEKNPEVGIVGPRLVSANGGIQHAGMQFMRLDELGVWVNHHPNAGLDPVLDPAKELTFVPAVTGACIALRKRDFNDLGGWDTGYLIGDFEDSDLCLKFRAAGFKIAYIPTVQLTHLERQSFKLLGADDFRQRVTLYNAARHQKRWRTLIEASCAQP